MPISRIVISDIPKELLRLREEIDRIDDEILSALARRFEVTARVGEFKACNGLESVDPVREQQKLQRIRDLARDKGIDSAFVSALFQQIFDEVVKRHQDLRKKHGRA